MTSIDNSFSGNPAQVIFKSAFGLLSTFLKILSINSKLFILLLFLFDAEGEAKVFSSSSKFSSKSILLVVGAFDKSIFAGFSAISETLGASVFITLPDVSYTSSDAWI